MPARTFEFTLIEFQFPAKLPNRKANFRLVVDLRYVSRRGDHTTAHAVLPGLDTLWECDPGRPDDPNYVRGARSGKRVSLDLARISDWDRLVLLVRGDGVHSIQCRVFDVNRSDPWDRLKSGLADVVVPLIGRGRSAVPDAGGLLTDALGSAASDMEAVTVARLAGGDDLLFRGSARLSGAGEVEIAGRGISGKYRAGFLLTEST